MKAAFIILVIIHALIHILGFLKGYDLASIRELSLPVSRTYGMIWLVTTIAMLTFGFFLMTYTKMDWLPGFIAVVLSQFLIIVFWQDAKFGTIPNLLILILCILSYAQFRFDCQVQRETAHLISQNNQMDKNLINEESISHLPPPVIKWLNNSGMIGKPMIHIGKISQQARLKMKPGQENWMHASAIQYSTIDTPSFIWKVNVKMNPFITITGRDRFQDGKGEMLIKIFSLVNIVNEHGNKLDEGALQRFLGEMVWFPSMALSSYLKWKSIDGTSAMATMTYNETQGSGTFHFNEEGDFTKFTAYRYMGNEPDSKRFNWILEVNEYKTFEGIKTPSRLTVTWQLEEGDWTWLEVEISDIKYNENALP